VAAATLAAPALVPATALGKGAAAPSDRVVFGSIGVGGRGQINTRIFTESAEAELAAVCDVDARHLAAGKKMVDDYYAAKPRAGRGPCAAYADFRRILERKEIDAVTIGAPDHWHAVMSIWAAQAGKDIYCEKPISVTIGEGRQVADTMRRLGRVYQSGTQRRSQAHWRLACELVRNGRLGKFQRVVELLGAGPISGPEPAVPVPPGFDYDLWLGPAPWAPYTPKRCHGNFRWFLDYSGGKITDQGAHFLDIAQWALDTEHTGPVEIEGRGTFPDEGLFDTPVTYDVTCRYASGVTMEVRDPLYRGDWAVRFEGTNGWLMATRDDLLASSPALKEPLGADAIPLQRSDHHQQNFLDAVRKGTRPISPPEVAHRSATVCHLCVLCLRLGRTLRWDPAEEQFLGDDAANRMLTRPMREPWTI
jgi:predicted dehydrogenase